MNKKEFRAKIREACSLISCNDCEYAVENCCTAIRAWDMLKKNGMLQNPQLDYSTLKTDDLLLVSDDLTADYVPRYFAKYEDEKLYCWINGATSKTSNGVTVWCYAKPYEEKEEYC